MSLINKVVKIYGREGLYEIVDKILSTCDELIYDNRGEPMYSSNDEPCYRSVGGITKYLFKPYKHSGEVQLIEEWPQNVILIDNLNE